MTNHRQASRPFAAYTPALQRLSAAEHGLVKLLSHRRADAGRLALRRGDAVVRLRAEGWSIAELVAVCERSRSALYDDKRLFALPSVVTSAVKAGVLGATSAVVLSRRRGHDQLGAALDAVLALLPGRAGQPPTRAVRRFARLTRARQ